MNLITVTSWEEVKLAFARVKKECLDIAMKENISETRSKFLYRGQSNAKWTLKTTLERVKVAPISVTEYYREVLKTRPQVEAFSETKWELVGLQEYTNWAESRSDLAWADYPGYEYMIYLRHHGFPSPLLDWTRSPYVSAYFAFSNIPDTSDTVAIYCYAETIGQGKEWGDDEPVITVEGPFVRSHKRHFMQQCEYTVCSRSFNDVLCYVSHEDVFKENRSRQDLLWKIEAPSSVARDALREMDLMNINELTLFGGEDALIHTLSTREYFIR